MNQVVHVDWDHGRITLFSHMEWAVYHFVRSQLVRTQDAAEEEMKCSWNELFMAAMMEEEMFIG